MQIADVRVGVETRHTGEKSPIESALSAVYAFDANAAVRTARPEQQSDMARARQEETALGKAYSAVTEGDEEVRCVNQVGCAEFVNCFSESKMRYTWSSFRSSRPC